MSIQQCSLLSQALRNNVKYAQYTAKLSHYEQADLESRTVNRRVVPG